MALFRKMNESGDSPPAANAGPASDGGGGGGPQDDDNGLPPGEEELHVSYGTGYAAGNAEE